MCVHRSCAGVGFLDGILYAVRGKNGSNVLSSVEACTPSTGVWTTISDIHLPRKNAGNFSQNNSKLFYETFFSLIYSNLT